MQLTREIISIKTQEKVVQVRFIPSQDILTANEQSLIQETNDPTLIARAQKLKAWDMDIDLIYLGGVVDKLGTIAKIEEVQRSEAVDAINAETASIRALLSDYDQISLLEGLN